MITTHEFNSCFLVFHMIGCILVMSDLQLQADNVFLAQGTLRPDLIESASSLASSKAHVIKTHHNDTELVRELRRKVRAVNYCCRILLQCSSNGRIGNCSIEL